MLTFDVLYEATDVHISAGFSVLSSACVTVYLTYLSIARPFEIN